MKDLASYAVFRADFPDDSKESDGEVVAPAGRNIMEAICRQLASASLAITQPAQRRFYGWTAQFPLGKATIWMLIQQPGPWLLIVEARASWLTGGKARADALDQGLALMRTALSADPRIKEPRWMTKTQFEWCKRNGTLGQ
jgi:hypothetical protein